MRSRLEARWAGTFDFLGWAWEYEPALDEAVSGWLPDFATEVAGTVWLVECKPALDHAGLEPARRKAEASGWRGPVLLLGAVWGVALAAVDCRTWRPAFIGAGPHGRPVLGSRGEPDEVWSWWLRLGWVAAGNRVQWRGR